jgi:hypothetical protein
MCLHSYLAYITQDDIGQHSNGNEQECITNCHKATCNKLIYKWKIGCASLEWIDELSLVVSTTLCMDDEYMYILYICHHKFHGSRFNINICAKFVFHRFVWNWYRCHSFTYIVWTLMLCVLFKHKCYMFDRIIKHEYCIFIRVIYKQKSCLQLLCLNNAWHLCLNNTNLWNNRFRMNLKRTHEIYTCYICHYFFHYFLFSILNFATIIK